MKIVVGGQIDKQKIVDEINKLIDEDVVVDVKNDLDAAMALQSGSYDYYLGACNTGGGGALAMVLALVGKDNCATISMPGSILSDDEIVDLVNDNKKAFGFTAQHIESVVPVLINAIQEKENK